MKNKLSVFLRILTVFAFLFCVGLVSARAESVDIVTEDGLSVIESREDFKISRDGGSLDVLAARGRSGGGRSGGGRSGGGRSGGGRSGGGRSGGGRSGGGSSRPQAQSRPQAMPQTSSPQGHGGGGHSGGGHSGGGHSGGGHSGGGHGGGGSSRPQARPISPPPKPPQITSFSLNKAGDGQGVITGRGIFCGYNCVNSNANYLKGTSISLSVSPQSGSKFKGWSGACGGTGSCNISMNAGKSVTARFIAMKNTLTVKITNSSGGSGTVSISEGQGKCSSSSCSHDYLSGKQISLVASANSGSEFKGWSGACSGSGSCSVAMNQAREVRANFAKVELATYSLNVSVSGNGYVQSMNVLLGNAIHSASGIDCGTSNSACSANYQDGMLVTIVAVPDEGYKFSRWEGDTCKGSNQECRVAITKSKSIQAYFEKK